MRQTLKSYAADFCLDLTEAVRLAADAHSCLRLIVDFVLFRVMRFGSVPLAGRPRIVRLRGGIRLAYRLDRADIYTIHEVWLQKMYRLPVALSPDTIIDLGANIGLSGVWMAKQYGCRRLIAVEPSPANATLAEANFRINAIPAQVVEAAVGAEDGTALFDEGPGATNGRIVSEKGAPNETRQHSVRMVSMETLMQSVPEGDGPVLLKIDIEGGEQALLTGPTDWLSRIDAIVIEFHPALVDAARLTAILTQAGFACVPAWSQESNDGNRLEFFQRAQA